MKGNQANDRDHELIKRTGQSLRQNGNAAVVATTKSNVLLEDEPLGRALDGRCHLPRRLLAGRRSFAPRLWSGLGGEPMVAGFVTIWGISIVLTWKSTKEKQAAKNLAEAGKVVCPHCGKSGERAGLSNA